MNRPPLIRSRSATVRARVTLARRRLQGRSMAIFQTAAAALAAWCIAIVLLPDKSPAFASIAAVIALGASHGEHRERALQLVGGVVLGLSVADVLIHFIGTGPLQLGLLVVLAMSAAVLLGGGEIVVSEAAVSAILLVVLDPSTGPGFSPNRILEAAIGGAVALTVGALLFPPDPVLLVGRAAQAVFGELGRALERVASALAGENEGSAERALLQARAIDELIDELDGTLATGRETVRRAPPRFAARSHIERYERSLTQIDLAVRNTRVLARHALGFVRDGSPVPADLPFAVTELAQSVWALAAAYDDPSRAEEARRCATSAAGRAMALYHEGHDDLALVATLAQVRSTAADLTRAAELIAGVPDELPTEELLVPVAA